MSSDSYIRNRYNVEHNSGGYDLNGTLKAGGNKMTNLVGYSSVTAGVNGYYENRTSSQNGIQLFDPDIQAMREPFRMGRFILKIMKFPPFFPSIACEMARWLFEDNARAVDGVPQNSISTISIEIGATQRSIDFPGMYKENGKDLTIRTPEWKGRPLGKFIEWWIGGLSDRETGIGHLWGRDMNYIKSNYGMSFLYIILGPTARAEDIEFSCMWHDCFPINEVASYMSSNTLGDVGSVGDQDVQFSGVYQTGLEIDLLAQIITAQTGLYNETSLNMILPAYMYKSTGHLAMTDSEINDTASLVSVSNTDRLEITKSQGVNEYDDTVLSVMKSVRNRAYGDESTGSNPKVSMPMFNQGDTPGQIQRALWNQTERASKEITPSE